MPPPSSPHREVRYYDHSVSDASDDNEDFGSLNTLNILSDLLLRNHAENPNATQGIEHSNRHSMVYGNELHINTNAIPMQIRNISGNRSSDISSDQETSLDLDDLRSDIHSNESLLLSSARQNHTNRNTLIPSSFRGVSLRRQNAIRHRDRTRSQSDINFTNVSFSNDILNVKPSDAEELLKDLKAAFRILKSLKGSPLKSPVFMPHKKHHSLLSHMCASNASSSNLDTIMRTFLEQSSRGHLWTSPVSKNGSHKLSTPPRIRKRSKHATSPNKKRKVNSGRPLDEAKVLLSSPLSLRPPSIQDLSTNQKFSIMKIPFSSFFRSGSGFSLKLASFQNLPIDLVFSSVDYDAKLLHGNFFVKYPTKVSNDTKSYTKDARKTNLDSYIKFFLGFSHNSDIKLRDKLLTRKLRILNNIENESSAPGAADDESKCFIIPFGGKMVDFMKNDLRFLPALLPSQEFLRCNIHLARAKSSRVRFQLLEWMKIQPFIQFKETFFFQHLCKAIKDMKRIKNHHTSNQRESISLACGLLNTMHDLTKSFPFMEGCDAHLPHIPNQKLRRIMTFTNYKKNLFIQEWDKKLTDKLTNFLTCREHCLLNVQLNYILFTLTIDISALLDDFIEHKLRFLSEESRKKYLYDLSKVKNSYSGTRNAVLLCSLDRSSGQIEIQNTKSCLELKNVSTDDVDLSPADSTEGETTFFHTFFSRFPSQSPPPESSLEESDFFQYDNDDSGLLAGEGSSTHSFPQETVLRGRSKNSNAFSTSFGSGNQCYSIT